MSEGRGLKGLVTDGSVEDLEPGDKFFRLPNHVVEVVSKKKSVYPEHINFELAEPNGEVSTEDIWEGMLLTERHGLLPY